MVEVDVFHMILKDEPQRPSICYSIPRGVVFCFFSEGCWVVLRVSVVGCTVGRGSDVVGHRGGQAKGGSLLDLF